MYTKAQVAKVTRPIAQSCGRKRFWFQSKCIEKLNTLQSEEKSIIFVSHFPDEVERICDHGILYQHGKIIQQGRQANYAGSTRRWFKE